MVKFNKSLWLQSLYQFTDLCYFVKPDASDIMEINSDQSLVYQVLQGFQDAELGVGEGQSALEIDRVGRLDGTVCAQFYGRTGYKGSRRHNDRRIIAWHIPGLRRHEAIH